MTFELMRLGWPNTAVILVLTLLPMVALVSGHGTARSEAAAFCPAAAERVTILASATPPSVVE